MYMECPRTDLVGRICDGDCGVIKAPSAVVECLAASRARLRHQRGGDRRHRLARRHHQADGLHRLRLDDRDGADACR